MMITRIPMRASALSFTTSSSLCLYSRQCLQTAISKPSPSFQFHILRLRQHSTQSLPSSQPSPLPSPPELSKRTSSLRSQFSPSSSTFPTNDYIPPKPKKKRSIRRYVYAATFLIIGMTAGQYVRLVLAPPPLPAAGTKEDGFMIEYIHSLAEKLPLVKALSEDPEWENYPAYTSIPEESKAGRLTTGALAGARALGGYQRVFYNSRTGEVITVVWFGGAIAGFPGVVHGGLLATVMDESLGRCAMKILDGGMGVTANLEIGYLKPVLTNGWGIVRCLPGEEGEGVKKEREVVGGLDRVVEGEKGRGERKRKVWVVGRLETETGKVCVQGRALYVVPKQVKLGTGGEKF